MGERGNECMSSVDSRTINIKNREKTIFFFLFDGNYYNYLINNFKRHNFITR